MIFFVNMYLGGPSVPGLHILSFKQKTIVCELTSIMARRFKLDYQTFQFICLIGVPSVGIYIYGKSTQKAPGDLEKHLEANYKRQVTAARKNNQALKEFWKKNGGVGKFNQETEARMDRVLRGGKTSGNNRINHENVAFHEAKKKGITVPNSSDKKE